VCTRFLASVESGAHPDYIAALLAATANATVVTTAFGEGWPEAPHRVLRVATERAAVGSVPVVARAAYRDRSWEVVRWSDQPPTAFTTGDVAAMAMYAGCGVGAIADVPTAAEIVERLMGEAAPLLAKGS
jgi:NAD(P)H-dependent flavin oxidoreductase YrpB (nitropropane dioxygenase family)